MRITVEVATPELVRIAEAWRAESGQSDEIVALEPGGDADVPVLEFFAGDVVGPDGESVALTAYRQASSVALSVVDRILTGSSELAGLNRALGRDTLRLFLAKQAGEPIRRMLARIAVAEGLNPGGRVVVWGPRQLPVEGLVPGIDPVRLRLAAREGGIRKRLAPLKAVAAAVIRTMGRREPVSAPSPGEPRPYRILVPHEDEIGLDPALRRQPHWMPGEDDSALFEALIYPVNRDLTAEAGDPALAAAGIRPLSRANIRDLRSRLPADAATARLSKWKAEALRSAVQDPSPAGRWAAGLSYRLLSQAESILATVVVMNVDAMLISDPHLIQSDAMAVVAELSGCPVTCYQYSNLAMPSVAMMTSADQFLTFHDAFQPLWSHVGVGPESFKAIGYPFDGAFSAVEARTRDARTELREAGATFVVCLFDESVQDDKFGVFSVSNHQSELRELLRYLLEEADVGLAVKSQFQSNTPSKRYPDDELVAAAAATGRFLELTTGDHRNLVYPAEAALISDIAIGNIVGATASLEAALAGRRSLLLDQHGQERHRRELYDKADLVYHSMTEAIAAIRRHRSGDPAAAALGDWTPIIDQFDAFRDGRSAERLRSSLTDLIEREKT